MKKILLFSGSTCLCLGFLVFAEGYAENLVQVYNDALGNDPQFKQAQATWMSAEQVVPLARVGNGTAGTGLYPNLAITGSYVNSNDTASGSGTSTTSNFDSSSVQVTVVQPLFNWATWQSIKSAHYTERATTAMYLAAVQNLISRVSTAYFEVLRAKDHLDLTIAQKRQFKKELDNVEQKYKAGVVAATNFYDAKASYDQAAAQMIRDENSLQDRFEELRAITGKRYKRLAPLKEKIPAVVPEPADVQRWVEVALRQNYTIQSDLNNMLASRQNVKVATASFLPTVNGIASYQDATGGGVAIPPAAGTGLDDRIQETQVGVSLSFPLISGGFNIVNTRQARYNYLVASEQLQIDYSTIAKNTRESYWNIESSISAMAADQESIFSFGQQLEATRVGYTVGTRTMEDILDSVSSVTQAQWSYANDRYDYVENIIQLKDQAGTLSPEDLKSVNSWLNVPSSPTHVTTQSAYVPAPVLTKPYTIEIFAARQEKNARAFYDKYKNQYPLTLQKNAGSEKMLWYRVLYGSYDSMPEALTVMKTLPEFLKAYRPWVIKQEFAK